MPPQTDETMQRFSELLNKVHQAIGYAYGVTVGPGTKTDTIDRVILQALAAEIEANSTFKCPWCLTPATEEQLKTHIDMRHRPDHYAPKNYISKKDHEAEIERAEVALMERQLQNARDELSHEHSYINNQKNIDHYTSVIKFIEESFEYGQRQSKTGGGK
jgi:hypothetical protein